MYLESKNNIRVIHMEKKWKEENGEVSKEILEFKCP
jgi:hypothetical protein